MSVDLYTRFRTAFEDVPLGGPLAPFDWVSLPDSMGPEAFVYGQMAPEFARELANGINQLCQDVRRLRAWAQICEHLSDLEKLDASGEFIEPLATFALNAPYALKAKFAFASAHLCHQADQLRLGRAWTDDLPADKDINWSTADLKGRGWKQFPGFKQAAAPIGGAAYRSATGDFRNAYTHRFAARVLIGMTQPVTRVVDPATKRVCYGIGGREPLGLIALADLLAGQSTVCLRAYSAFQSLVQEQSALFKPARRLQGPAPTGDDEPVQ